MIKQINACINGNELELDLESISYNKNDDTWIGGDVDDEYIVVCGIWGPLGIGKSTLLDSVNDSYLDGVRKIIIRDNDIWCGGEMSEGTYNYDKCRKYILPIGYDITKIYCRNVAQSRLLTIMYNVTEILESGGLLLIDELELYLHEDIVEYIIELFRSKVTNPHRSQLIFTSNNSTVMEYMELDEIYIMDTNLDKLELYSVIEFKNLEKDVRDMYIRGKLGGVHFIRNWEVLLEDKDDEKVS